MAEYAGLVVLAALVLSALVATGIPAQLGSGVGAQICKVFGGADCGTSPQAQPLAGKGNQNGGGQNGTPADGQPNDRRGNERDARDSRRGRHGGDENTDKGTPGQQTPTNPLGDPVDGTTVPEPDPPAWNPPDKGAGKYNSESAGFSDYGFKFAVEAAANAVAGTWPHASSNLLHYLANDGKPLQQDVNQMLKDEKGFRDAVAQDRDNLGATAVEEAKKRGAKGPITFPVNTAWKGGTFQNKDWFYAVGSYQYNQTGQVTVYPPDTPGGKWRYEVKTHVNFRDQYNWDHGKATNFGPITVTDDDMASLHRKGLAQEYSMYGRSDEETTKGEAP